jgi:hypothetical protein
LSRNRFEWQVVRIPAVEKMSLNALHRPLVDLAGKVLVGLVGIGQCALLCHQHEALDQRIDGADLVERLLGEPARGQRAVAQRPTGLGDRQVGEVSGEGAHFIHPLTLMMCAGSSAMVRGRRSQCSTSSSRPALA